MATVKCQTLIKYSPLLIRRRRQLIIKLDKRLIFATLGAKYISIMSYVNKQIILLVPSLSRASSEAYWGVARIFQRGCHTVSNIIVMAFSPRNIVGCLLKKGLQRGGHGHLGTPPLATPLSLTAQYFLLLCQTSFQKKKQTVSTVQSRYLRTQNISYFTHIWNGLPDRSDISVYEFPLIYHFPPPVPPARTIYVGTPKEVGDNATPVPGA